MNKSSEDSFDYIFEQLLVGDSNMPLNIWAFVFLHMML